MMETLIERLERREAELLAGIPSNPRPPVPRGTRSSNKLRSETWRQRVDLEAKIAKQAKR